MKIEDITGNARSIDDQINVLKVRNVPNPCWPEINKAIILEHHDVFDRFKRKDNITYPNPVADAAGKIIDKGEPEIDYVNRIGLAMQQLIIKRAVSFLFGNPVIIKYDAQTENEKAFISAFKAVIDENFEAAVNRKVARNVFSFTEAAEYWYTVEAEEGFNDYGVKTNRELKSVVFCAENGDTIYPNINEYGDLEFFSRSFTRKQGNLTFEYFETYTDEEVVKWKRSSVSSVWMEYSREPVTIGRNPVNYIRQRGHETKDVDGIIARIEQSISNLGDINDRHTAPKIFVNGKIISFGRKNASNTVIEGGPNTDAKYLAWDHAPDSFKIEVEFLIRQAFAITQTPDISFEAVKGIGTLSGVALKLLFLDAHLKVKDKEEIILPFLKTRDKILSAYLCEMNIAWKKDGRIPIKREIDPFMIADDLTQAQILQIATGSMPWMSQLQAIKEWGTSDPESEMQQLADEAANDAQRSLFEPTS